MRWPQLVRAGKVRFLGLSEASSPTIRRARRGASDLRPPDRVFPLDPGPRGRRVAHLPGARHRIRGLQPAGPRVSHWPVPVARRSPVPTIIAATRPGFRERTSRRISTSWSASRSWPAALRPAALGHRLGDRRRQAGLHRQQVVRIPFVLRRPFPGGDQDGQLVQRRRDGAVEAQVFAELLEALRHLRAAQHGREGAAQAAARAATMPSTTRFWSGVIASGGRGAGGRRGRHRPAGSYPGHGFPPRVRGGIRACRARSGNTLAPRGLEAAPWP